MPHAMIRGANGRRHEVDFGDAPVRVEIYSTEETVEIFIEVDLERLPEERRRFAILNIPRHLLAKPLRQPRDVPRAPVLRRGADWISAPTDPEWASFPFLVNPRETCSRRDPRGYPLRTRTGPPRTAPCPFRNGYLEPMDRFLDP
jgi:hypothetical protein